MELRLPAEFEKHKATWMIWPYRLDTWHSDANPARHAFSAVANAISEFEPVKLIIRQEDVNYAKSLLNDSIQLFTFPFDSEWARDTGPIFVKDESGKTVGIDFEFDSWSGIYSDYLNDNLLAGHILKLQKYPKVEDDFVLEGGSIHVDGEGTLFATEECLFSPKRKEILSKAQVEEKFAKYFGVTKTIWFKKGIYKDIVNGHIDNLCCFVKPGVVALTWTEDINDPQYKISQEAYQLLSQTKDAKGRSFEITKINQPDPMYVTAEENKIVGESFYTVGERLCGSYINFYIVNGGVIMPSFGDLANDKLAFNNICKLFPDRKVMQIPSREILIGGGAIHCITMQEPV